MPPHITLYFSTVRQPDIPQLCPDMVFAATPPYDGTLARYYPIPADLCYKLPDNLTLEDGAMVRPRPASTLPDAAF